MRRPLQPIVTERGQDTTVLETWAKRDGLGPLSAAERAWANGWLLVAEVAYRGKRGERWTAVHYVYTLFLCKRWAESTAPPVIQAALRRNMGRFESRLSQVAQGRLTG